MTSPRRVTSRPSRSHRRAVRATTAVTSAVALVALTGCSVDLSRLPAAVAGALVPFDACDDALAYLREAAVGRVGPYGLDGYGYLRQGFEESTPPSAPASAPTEAGADGGTGSYSTTNNQEAGVDEADVVKTDGSYVYTALDGVLRVTDVRGDVPEVVGELDLAVDAGGGASAQLLVVGDLALVTIVGTQVWFGDMLPAPTSPDGHGIARATLVTVDLTDRSAPRETSRLAVDGTIAAARLVDGAARVVVQSSPMIPFEQPAYDVPEAEGWTDEDYAERWSELEDAATERNRELAATATIDDWLPGYALDGPDGETSGTLVPCERLSHPVDFAGFGTTTVLTVELGEGAVLKEPVATSVLGSGETVYASTDRLYVATSRWESPAWNGVGDVMMAPTETSTGIHAFDITGEGPAAYVGSGEVDGRIIGQYALSEHEGVLRVATTDDGTWTDGGSTSESSVTTLGERDGALVELGSVGGLGKGEQIYAVRYLGDTAYVVTFRQTDPLYVLDLSDPAAPVVDGELKITGYSSYLHPLAEARLLGVGQEATEQGMTVGLQVSLFDTADPSAPTKIDGEVVADAYASAEWDPHAFLFWEETGQVVLPMSGSSRGGLLVLSVTDDGISRDGIVRAAREIRDGRYAAPERSLVVGDRLVTVWWGGVQTNDLASLDELGSATFG